MLMGKMQAKNKNIQKGTTRSLKNKLKNVKR